MQEAEDKKGLNRHYFPKLRVVMSYKKVLYGYPEGK